METRTPAAPDEVRRFIIENRPVRGHWVHLENAWCEVRAHHEYPPAVRELLGQAVSASVLLAATLKFQGTLTLQLQGDGVVRLLVAQCTHDFRVRAVARVDESRLAELRAGDGAAPAETFRALVGQEGRVVVTIEAESTDMRYQGIVPLTGATLAESLEAYFATSEQLPTRVHLAADSRRAAGLLVQKMPAAGGREPAEEREAESAWQDAQHGIAGVQSAELLDLPVESLLTRSFGERDLRLFAGSPVRFECRCCPERVAGLLRALGAEEVRDVLRQEGAVTVTCDFCQRPYRFDAADVERLFTAGASAPDGSAALH